MNIVLWIIFLPVILFVIGTFLLGYAKKFIARVERRYGPPVQQVFYDTFKLMTKKTNISHGWMHDVAILMLLGGTILTMYFVPVPGFSYFAKYGDMLVVMYLLLIPSLGMALGVGETANPNGSIGIARALTMLAGYDIPFVLTFIGFAVANHTTSIYELMTIQQTGGFSSWGIMTNPLLAIAGLIALHGMMGKKPFEVVVAPHEIATGPMVEMGGKYLGIMMIQHAIAIMVEMTIYIDLFMGGAVNWIEYLIKIFVLWTVMLAVGAVFGRFRTDDAVRFMWKIPLPMAVIGVLFIIF